MHRVRAFVAILRHGLDNAWALSRAGHDCQLSWGRCRPGRAAAPASPACTQASVRATPKAASAL